MASHSTTYKRIKVIKTWEIYIVFDRRWENRTQTHDYWSGRCHDFLGSYWEKDEWKVSAFPFCRFLKFKYLQVVTCPQILTEMRQRLSSLSEELLSPARCLVKCQQTLCINNLSNREMLGNSPDNQGWWEQFFGHRRFGHVYCRCDESEPINFEH